MAKRSVVTTISGQTPDIPFPPGFELTLIGEKIDLGFEDREQAGTVTNVRLTEGGLKALVTVEWEDGA